MKLMSHSNSKTEEVTFALAFCSQVYIWKMLSFLLTNAVLFLSRKTRSFQENGHFIQSTALELEVIYAYAIFVYRHKNWS